VRAADSAPDGRV